MADGVKDWTEAEYRLAKVEAFCGLSSPPPGAAAQDGYLWSHDPASAAATVKGLLARVQAVRLTHPFWELYGKNPPSDAAVQRMRDRFPVRLPHELAEVLALADRVPGSAESVTAEGRAVQYQKDHPGVPRYIAEQVIRERDRKATPGGTTGGKLRYGPTMFG